MGYLQTSLSGSEKENGLKLNASLYNSTGITSLLILMGLCEKEIQLSLMLHLIKRNTNSSINANIVIKKRYAYNPEDLLRKT